MGFIIRLLLHEEATNSKKTTTFFFPHGTWRQAFRRSAMPTLHMIVRARGLPAGHFASVGHAPVVHTPWESGSQRRSNERNPRCDAPDWCVLWNCGIVTCDMAMQSGWDPALHRSFLTSTMMIINPQCYFTLFFITTFIFFLGSEGGWAFTGSHAIIIFNYTAQQRHS